MQVVEALAAVLLLGGLLLAAVAVRRRVLERQGGTVELSLRVRSGSGGGWVFGLGRFDGDDLRWYRVLSLSPRPRRTLSRRDLRVLGRRDPSRGETLALMSGAVVVECVSPAGAVELALDPGTVPGFLAWLEARPPGATLPG